MAGLQAEQLSNEFLKNFLPETIYQVGGDMAAPAPAPAVEPEPVQATAAAPDTMHKAPVAASKPATATAHQIPSLPRMPKAEAAAASGKYKVIGGNNKGVIILVTLPDDQFQKLPQLGFLQKILFAIGLKTDDVAYLNNVSGAIAKYEDLKQEMQVNYIISFASRLDTDLTHEKFTLYNPVKVGDVPVVFSLALEKLEHDVEQKKLLWGALQQMFL